MVQAKTTGAPSANPTAERRPRPGLVKVVVLALLGGGLLLGMAQALVAAHPDLDFTADPAIQLAE